MWFKIDENLPIEVAEMVRNAGHDAWTVHDQGMVGSPDPNIAAVCRSENRALITLDLDFSDIRTYPPKEHHGIVVLRPRSQAKPHVLQLLAHVIPLFAHEPLGGKLWIVQESGLRIREG